MLGAEETTQTEFLIEGVYTNEELENISGLCDILQKIRTRIISEGYSIEELRKSLPNGSSKVV